MALAGVVAERSARPGLRAGLVRRPHGVRGDVRLLALGGEPERFHQGLRLWSEAARRWYTVARARVLEDGDVLAGFAELSDREAAGRLASSYLRVEAGESRRLGEGEWFVHQLVGLRVETPEGRLLGRVRDVEECPAHDVLLVADGATERRFPMTREFVERVDPGAGLMVVTPWEEA